MKRILAIDYGLKKTGIAFFDGNLVEPLEVIRNPDQQKVVSRVCQLVDSLDVDQIILGIPESGRLVAAIRSLGQNLLGVTNIPVKYHQETLTTQAAIDRIKLIGGSRKKRQNEDAIAAGLLLEDFLEVNGLR